jgi:hypothetical protein
MYEKRIDVGEGKRSCPFPDSKVFYGEILLERLKLAIEIFVASAAILGMPG